jgi:hypothetical protein
MGRREVLRLLAATPLPRWLGCSPGTLEGARAAARRAAEQAGGPPRFFTATEWETVRILADLVLPRDERSGSATDAGVPEFMDFILAEGGENPRIQIRGGVTWLDRECRRRWRRPFRELAEPERTAMLDDIAWPKRAQPEMSQGVAFFNRFRDLVAAGFWSSQMGVEDLGYQGNTAVPEWTGCPEAQLRKLGV